MLSPNRLVKVFSPMVIVGSASFIAGVAATIVFFSIRQIPSSGYIIAAYGQVAETIQASGTVEPTGIVALSFERGGTINLASVNVGESVRAKELLASVSIGNLAGQLSAAKANLSAEKVKLAVLESSTSPEEFAALQKNLADALTGSYQTGSAAEGVTQQFISEGSSPSLSFMATDADLVAKVLAEKQQTDSMLGSWQQELLTDTPTTTPNALLADATAAADDLSAIDTFLNHADAALARAIISSAAPPNTLEQYQSSVSNARLSIANALTALNSAAGKLSLAEAPASSTIDLENSAMQAAQAKVDSIMLQIGQTELRAPIEGVITEQLRGVGETVAAGQPIFMFSSSAHFQMTASIPPQSLHAISVGQDAVIALTNYPQKTFATKVVAVTPNSITAQFVTDDPLLKPGLAGSITIANTPSQEALLVPQSAVLVESGKSYVVKFSPNTSNNASPNASPNASRDELTPVDTGIVTSDGKIEILSGLSAGDRVRASAVVY